MCIFKDHKGYIVVLASAACLTVCLSMSSRSKAINARDMWHRSTKKREMLLLLYSISPYSIRLLHTQTRRRNTSSLAVAFFLPSFWAGDKYNRCTWVFLQCPTVWELLEMQPNCILVKRSRVGAGKLQISYNCHYNYNKLCDSTV